MGGGRRTRDGLLLELIGDVCGLLDIEELRFELLRALQRMLPSDYVSLNDVGPGPEDVVTLALPEAPAELLARWAAHAHENPLLRRYLATQDGRAHRFSDVISREELHRTPLYREVYAPRGVEYQLAFSLPGQPHRVLGIALSRCRHDYTDAERDLADRARPYLAQAYLNAVAYSALLDRTGGVPAFDGSSLDGPLGMGLTPRQGDVLRLVALGRSNQHIAAELGISPRTVAKHLELGFRKLDVSNRSSAAARVWELARQAGAGQPAPAAPAQRAAAVVGGARPGGSASTRSSVRV